MAEIDPTSAKRTEKSQAPIFRDAPDMQRSDVPRGPDGIALTRADLPRLGERWTQRRKAIVAILMHYGDVTAAEVHSLYALHADEVRYWYQTYQEQGLPGLRSTYPMRRMDTLEAPPESAENAVTPVDTNIQAAPPPTSHLIGDVVYERDFSTLCGDKAGSVELAGKEDQIFELLRQKLGEPVSKRALFHGLYPSSTDEPDLKIIDVFLCKLRKKLDTVSNNVRIKTVWGLGYQLGVMPTTAAQ